MDKITLQISPAKARQLHRTASAEIKAILEESTTKGFFSDDPTKFVNSYETACEYWGIEPMNEEEMLRAGFRQDEIDRRKLETITFVLNNGEYLDWKDGNARKCLSWFEFSAPSGFAFGVADFWRTFAYAGSASRLCFKSEELARHAGESPKIAALYKSVIDNKPTE